MLQEAQAGRPWSTHAQGSPARASTPRPARCWSQAGLGDLFIHRTGHGIGLETHEDPYIVSGNTLVLDEGMAFSIEPGFYVEGRYGARIEDIVIATADGVIVANQQPRDLVVA